MRADPKNFDWFHPDYDKVTRTLRFLAWFDN